MLLNAGIIGGSTAWTPAKLTTAFWAKASDSDTLFDATSGGSLPAADGEIARLEDKSGNARHLTQSASGSRPIRKVSLINGRDVMRLDGTNDALRMANQGEIARSVGAFMIFATFNTTGGDSTRRAVFRVSVSNSARSRAGLWATSTGVEAGGRRLDADAFQSVTASGTGWVLGSAILDYSGANLQVGVNGAYVNLSGGFQTAGNTSNTASDNVYVGANEDSSNMELFGGDIHEIVAIRSSLLSTDDREKLEGYMLHEIGLAANLPSGHPYKTVAP